MLSNLLENKLVLSLLVIIPVYFLYFHDWEDTFIKDEVTTDYFYNSTVKDFNGKDVPLNEYKNQWILVNFWATWCPPCKAEIPDLNRFNQLHSKDVKLIGIAVDDKKAVKKFVNKVPIGYTSLISNNEGMSISRSLGNDKEFLPFTVLINPQNQLEMVFVGMVDLRKLNEMLGELRRTKRMDKQGRIKNNISHPLALINLKI